MLLFYKLEKRGGGDQLELSNLLRDWRFLKAPQGLALTKHLQLMMLLELWRQDLCI